MHYLNLGDFSGRKLLRMGLTLVILITGTVEHLNIEHLSFSCNKRHSLVIIIITGGSIKYLMYRRVIIIIIIILGLKVLAFLFMKG